MATLSTFSALPSTRPLNSRKTLKPFVAAALHFKTHAAVSSSFNSNIHLRFKNNVRLFKNSHFHGFRRIKSVEEETQVPEEEAQVPEEEAQVPEEEAPEEVQEQGEQQTVSVPVSPSDTLTMYFEAEGTMSESAIPNVTKALEQTEGVTDLKVQIEEGIASVELRKQTTVQATGVASSLVELIQGSGFKLQTLNLSFGDQEDFVVV